MCIGSCGSLKLSRCIHDLASDLASESASAPSNEVAPERTAVRVPARTAELFEFEAHLTDDANDNNRLRRVGRGVVVASAVAAGIGVVGAMPVAADSAGEVDENDQGLANGQATQWTINPVTGHVSLQ